MTYVIYHIPGRKIGVTNNLKSRVEDQQGYTEDEYEVLEMSDDISYISDRELELQKQYGYRVDRQLYKDLYTTNFIELNNMKINVTEATTTFPCPINKLKGRLMDEKGMQWTTDHGTFTVNGHSINWILNNAKESMYNKERCYIYNKAFAGYYDKDPMRNMAMGPTHEAETEYQKEMVDYYKKKSVSSNMSQFDLIREWANERGLYDKGDPKTQYVKLIEEAGEVGRAILKNDTPEIIDGIGDMVVVLTNLAELTGTPIEDCIQAAYDVISKRTGKMKNGTFVKDTL
jgi:NTP pyrophosphatase (non-canonical NTP hydrolase)